MHSADSRAPASKNLAHLVLGAGGTRAILAPCGSILGFQLAEIDWKSIGAVSGGANVGILLASGYTPTQLVQFALQVNFDGKVVRKAGAVETLWSLFMKHHYERAENRNGTGILDMKQVEEYIDSLVPAWPEKFWTVAVVDNDDIVVFKKDGIFEYKNGKCIKLASDPGKPGFAVHASCAIPGLVQPPVLAGRHLYDGAFSKYGVCPVGISTELFGHNSSTVAGVCVGEDSFPGLKGAVHNFWKELWGVPQDNSWGPHSKGVVGIHPRITHIHSLSFKLSSDEKWLAILEGFNTTVMTLAKHGLLTGERLERAKVMMTELPSAKNAIIGGVDEKQIFGAKVERVFSKHGLI